MGKTKIEYADEVSNPIYAVDKTTGKKGTHCEKPDAEGTCKGCWAEALNKRFGTGLSFDKSNRDKIEWKVRQKEIDRMARLNAKKPMSEKFKGLPLVVFCFDTFDIFQPSITDEMRDFIFDNYDEFTNLILLVQTTYPSKMRNYFRARYGAEGLPSHYWIGMSVGTQPFFDRNIHALRDIKAKEKYVIFEPLLERINLNVEQILYDANVNKTPQFTFSIIGGESGGNARACDIDWIRFLAQQLKQAEIRQFVKQLGANVFDSSRSDIWFDGKLRYENVADDGEEANYARQCLGSELQPATIKLKNKKGGDISEFPEDLRVREMPK